MKGLWLEGENFQRQSKGNIGLTRLTMCYSDVGLTMGSLNTEFITYQNIGGGYNLYNRQ